MFLNYLPLGNKDSKRNQGAVASVFTLYSRGVATSRDAWAYNFSQATLAENMQRTIEFYNSEVTRYQRACEGKNNSGKPGVNEFINYDSTQLHWDREIKNDLAQGICGQYHNANIRQGMYRPFTKQHFYFCKQFNSMVYQQLRIFPEPGSKNLAICVPGIGSNKEFSALMVNTVPDLNLQHAGGQCFPRYHFLTADGQGRQAALVMGETKHNRDDNISEETVARFREHYRESTIDADAVFHYVYGLLHSSGYKTRFAVDLKKMLPRIPLVESPEDFRGFSEAGRALAELHVGYEEVEGWPLTIRDEQPDVDEKDRFRVSTMRFGGTAKAPDKTVICYNNYITVEQIPLEAYQYVVNGKSAIEWVMERYQVTQHKDSKIVNDPNAWSDDPRYILALLGKVVTVSMKTVEIVARLPGLGSNS